MAPRGAQLFEKIFFVILPRKFATFFITIIYTLVMVESIQDTKEKNGPSWTELAYGFFFFLNCYCSVGRAAGALNRAQQLAIWRNLQCCNSRGSLLASCILFPPLLSSNGIFERDSQVLNTMCSKSSNLRAVCVAPTHALHCRNLSPRARSIGIEFYGPGTMGIALCVAWKERRFISKQLECFFLAEYTGILQISEASLRDSCEEVNEQLEF